MSLIKSISGIRGTIGDADGLDPITVVKYTLAFASVINKNIQISLLVFQLVETVEFLVML